MKNIILLYSLVAWCFVGSQSVYAFTLRGEFGLSQIKKNDLRVPGTTGTLFKSSNELKNDSIFYYRVEPSVGLGAKWTLKGLYAPFQVEKKVTLSERLVFNNSTFTQGEEVDFLFKFNSYRLTIAYCLYCGPSLLQIGFTGKIRDAEIRFTSSSINDSYSNVGFVPLFHFYWLYSFNPLSLFLSLDGSAAPQGRAFDLAVGSRLDISDKIQLDLGVRGLEGGADNDKVLNWALYVYYFAALNIKF